MISGGPSIPSFVSARWTLDPISPFLTPVQRLFSMRLWGVKIQLVFLVYLKGSQTFLINEICFIYLIVFVGGFTDYGSLTPLVGGASFT